VFATFVLAATHGGLSSEPWVESDAFMGFVLRLMLTVAVILAIANDCIVCKHFLA